MDLRDFVNREEGIAYFEAILAEPRRRILLLHGPEGIGKSWLLRRFLHLCQETERTAALLDLGSPRLADEGALIRTLSAQCGADFAAHFQQAEAELGPAAREQANGGKLPAFGQGSGVSIGSVGGDVTVGGDLVGGHKIVLNNSPVVVNLGSEPGPAPFLTMALRRALLRFLADRPLVLLFDHLTRSRGQEATPQTGGWLRHAMVEWLLTEPAAFANLWLVVAGRQPPFAAEVDGWPAEPGQFTIPPLPEAAIRQYWVEVRRLNDQDLPAFIQASGGNPGLLNLMARNVASVRGSGSA